MSIDKLNDNWINLRPMQSVICFEVFSVSFLLFLSKLCCEWWWRRRQWWCWYWYCDDVDHYDDVVIIVVVVVAISATLPHQISKLSSTMCSLTMTVHTSENILRWRHNSLASLSGFSSDLNEPGRLADCWASTIDERINRIFHVNTIHTIHTNPRHYKLCTFACLCRRQCSCLRCRRRRRRCCCWINRRW